jgi:uncharacterized cofD-like protein
MGSRIVSPLRWLLPGINVKRWVLLAFIGALFMLDGIMRWLVAEGVSVPFNEIIDNVVDDYFSPSYLTYIFVGVGIALIVIGVRGWLRSLVKAAASSGGGRILDSLMDRRLEAGYNIVAIGGGTGLSTLLRGLKRRTSNLTAIVTVSDDGGSSGRLQKELGVLPPGDVRNCLVALADNEALVTDLFRYRFEEGEGLSGHSFGNLFLAAMTGITGNFDRAVKESSRVLNIVGRVLPATLSVVRLCAELYDGRIIEGESNIPKAKGRIKRVFFDPSQVVPLDEALDAIAQADAIVLGPGSLYTSVLPNFLIDQIAAEVARARGVKIYICNVMTQPGETENMTAADHVEALFAGAGAPVAEYVIVNDEPPSKLRKTYEEEGQLPVVLDLERIEAMGLTAVRAEMLSENENVRHDPDRLGSTVLSLIDQAVAERATFVKPARAYTKAASAAASRH